MNNHKTLCERMHLAQQSKLFIQANINISSLSSVRDQVIETNMQVLQRFVVGSAFTRFRLLKVQHSPVMSVFSNALHSSTSIADRFTGITTRYPYAAYIKFQFAVWEEFKNYEGKIQYYFFGRRFGHGGVCFRFHESDIPAKAELIIDKFQEEDKWFIRVKTTEWRPRCENKVEVSKHNWHVGAMLHVAHRFSQGKFRNYHKLCNNCNDWKKEVVCYMREKGPLKDLCQLDDIIRQLLKEGVVLEFHH